MIIPIGHDQQIRRLPWVTITIIAICTLVQTYTQFAAPGMEELKRFIEGHDHVTTLEGAAAFEQQFSDLLDKVPIWRFGYHTDSGLGYTVVTSAFVHVGWMHLIGNMLFLWMVGSVLEDRWGRAKYLAFYLGSAVVANLVFGATYHGDGTILVGASGAISGVMGAFLIFYAGTQITFWYFLMLRTGTFRLAAYFALPLWLGEQVLWAFADQLNPKLSGVAYAAHIGGFMFGLAFALRVNLIFGRRAHDDDGTADPPIPVATASMPAAAVAVAADRGRYDKCMDAIKNRDAAATRTLASRTILDLARAGAYTQVLGIYDAIKIHLSSVPLTDGAFAALALAADTTNDANLYVRIADDFNREQPGSIQLPKVLWRLAQIHRDARRVELAVAALEALAERFGHDPFGIQAREALASRH